MKRAFIIIGVVSIVLLCGFVYAENQSIIEPGAEKQIILAGNSNCVSECGMRESSCKYSCTYAKGGMPSQGCLDSCSRDYNQCMDRCGK